MFVAQACPKLLMTTNLNACRFILLLIPQVPQTQHTPERTYVLLISLHVLASLVKTSFSLSSQNSPSTVSSPSSTLTSYHLVPVLLLPPLLPHLAPPPHPPASAIIQVYNLMHLGYLESHLPGLLPSMSVFCTFSRVIVIK